MNERINYLKTYILDKRHHSQRRTPSSIGLDKLNTIYAQQGLSPVERATACFAALMNAELPVILPGEKIVFTRTLTQVPDIYTPEEWNEIKNKYYIHEKGTVCNISPNYAYTIQHGLEARKQEIRKRQENPSLNERERVFLNSMYQCIISIQKLIEKYEQYALLNCAHFTYHKDRRRSKLQTSSTAFENSPLLHLGSRQLSQYPRPLRSIYVSFLSEGPGKWNTHQRRSIRSA